MSWMVLFWNLQGTGKNNVKLQTFAKVIDGVQPDIIGLAEVGLWFPFEQFGDFEFKEYRIRDKNGDETPKGLAVGIRRGQHLQFTSDLIVLQDVLYTSDDEVELRRPILKVMINDVEVILVHAPSTSNGQLGRVTVANVFDYFRDQCKGSRGTYKGFAIGDFNTPYAPYTVSVFEEYVERFPMLNLKKKSSWKYMIRSCDPGWGVTQKSGRVLDFMITCGVVGMADLLKHSKVPDLNSSIYVDKILVTPRRTFTNTGEPKLVEIAEPGLDSIYGLVKDSLDTGFYVHEYPREQLPGWFIDHRPVIYDVLNPTRGPDPPIVIEKHINNPHF